MNFQFIKPTSIKHKVILNIIWLVIASFIITMFVALFSLEKLISQQTDTLLKKEVAFIQEKVELRLEYLLENTQLLATNSLVVNALSDTLSRDKYLPALIDNFIKGKDVSSLNIVDYDGKVIFKIDDYIPTYNESKDLRKALALNQQSIYISNKRFFVIKPIEYYSTTQGALIVSFNLASIMKNSLINDRSIYVKLITGEDEVFTHNFITTKSYESYKGLISNNKSILKRLNTYIEVGVLEDVYNQPLRNAIVTILLLGLLLLVSGVFFAVQIAKTITSPILKLHNKVKNSQADKNIFCAPLGTHDELETLAEAFDEKTLSLQYQAEHDALTGLPNRVLFKDRLNQAIKNAKRDKSSIAVLFIDLDRFKEVNDSFGHSFGDKLLCLVSDKISEYLRESDTLARLGGDEFTIMLDSIKNDSVLAELIQKVMNIFDAPFYIESEQFYITASIGVSLYPENGEDPETLLKNADTAMYRAKEDGKNMFQFYIDNMTIDTQERFELENSLRDAVTNREFVVYYQPQVDMSSNDIIGLEALVRWNSSKYGFVSPNKFVPIAEETGIIVDIDRIVMHTAFAEQKKLLSSGLYKGVLSVNLSIVQLNRTDFLEYTRKLLLESQVDPKYIMFEVTETQVMKNPEQSIIILNKLKKLGVGIAIDDFGTGHSSLSYLKRIPADKIKIDQSFVRDIPQDKDDMELTRTIIAMSHGLKRRVIAEGVETLEQSEFLIENGCLEAQGYFYHKPLPIAQVIELLE